MSLAAAAASCIHVVGCNSVLPFPTPPITLHARRPGSRPLDRRPRCSLWLRPCTTAITAGCSSPTRRCELAGRTHEGRGLDQGAGVEWGLLDAVRAWHTRPARLVPFAEARRQKEPCEKQTRHRPTSLLAHELSCERCPWHAPCRPQARAVRSDADHLAGRRRRRVRRHSGHGGPAAAAAVAVSLAVAVAAAVNAADPADGPLGPDSRSALPGPWN
jgi:hypothetical protein